MNRVHIREGEQERCWVEGGAGCWEDGAVGVVVSQIKHPPTPPSPSFWAPEFSLSVDDNCLEGWSDNTVSQTSGCLGAGRRDRIWSIPTSMRRDGGRGAGRGAVGRWVSPPLHTSR